jgi:hypothetical protein
MTDNRSCYKSFAPPALHTEANERLNASPDKLTQVGLCTSLAEFRAAKGPVACPAPDRYAESIIKTPAASV